MKDRDTTEKVNELLELLKFWRSHLDDLIELLQSANPDLEHVFEEVLARMEREKGFLITIMQQRKEKGQAKQHH